MLVITDIHHQVSTVTYAVYFALGFLYETKAKQGITHLVEHMFFRCLHAMKQEELYYRFESMGGTVRGTTSKQYVCFDLTVVADYAKEAFALMKEFFADFDPVPEEIFPVPKTVMDKRTAFQLPPGL